jgi:NAD(P)-dependent dehydrogenase (short-subunit alcohol dehydrogenase family)
MAAPLYDVNGRTVFITGAARGIGAAAAERLHAKGANVALVGLEPERLAALAARLGERRTAWFETDVTDLDALRKAVDGTVARFGDIDVAIANAGIAFTGSLAGAPVEQVERTLAVNFLGVWRTDRAVIEQIVERRGYLLNISSLSAVAHAPLMGPYTAAKAGVEALTDALRMESAPSGARIGCAYFGFIDTDLVKAAYAQPSAQLMNKRTPAFLRGPAPLSTAIDAIERGIGRRSARVWAPRWVGAAIALRGVLQPLTERGARRDPATLAEGIRLADHPAADARAADPLLGIATEALDGAQVNAFAER